MIRTKKGVQRPRERERVIKELSSPEAFPVRVSRLGEDQKRTGTGNNEYVFLFDWFKLVSKSQIRDSRFGGIDHNSLNSGVGRVFGRVDLCKNYLINPFGDRSMDLLH